VCPAVFVYTGKTVSLRSLLIIADGLAATAVSIILTMGVEAVGITSGKNNRKVVGFRRVRK